MHELPVWFLIFALFVPRIALFIGWHHGWPYSVPQPGAALCWFFLPRVLVLLTVYTAQGFSTWFWIHLGAAVFFTVRGWLSAQSASRKAAK